MMRIDYHNMPVGSSRTRFALRYLLNCLRTWLLFHVRYRQVSYEGFVRVMHGTSFGPGIKVRLGHNVQFGDYCNVSTDLTVGHHVLFAGRVCFVGRQDHSFDTAGEYIWNGCHVHGLPTVVGNDVWLGHRVTVVGPVTIGDGAVVAAGAVVTKDIPPCEVWGGVPARKLRDRFGTIEEKQKHLEYLRQTGYATT